MAIILEELVGKKFGSLTVIRAYRDDKSRVKCISICDCGRQSESFYSNLKTGKTKSCGHLERKNREKHADMTGEKIGELTVLAPTTERKEGCIVWLCKCSCGEWVYASRRQLVRGYITKCRKHKLKELIGKQFGHLVVKNFNKDRNSLLCECDCGTWMWIKRSNVINGHTRSCGHLRRQDTFPRIDGVVPSALRKKKSISNTSGTIGVSKTKSGKYVSYITFKNQRHTLGLFEDIEDAKIRRQQAVQKYFRPYLIKEKNSTNYLEKKHKDNIVPFLPRNTDNVGHV